MADPRAHAVDSAASAVGAHALAPELLRLLRSLGFGLLEGEACDVAALRLATAAPDDTLLAARAAFRFVFGAVPFRGSIEAGSLPADLRLAVRSRRADLVAIGWTLAALQIGARAVLVVPESVLTAATQAHRLLRRRLLEQNTLRAVLRLRAGLFQPRTRAAVLVLDAAGVTGHVWFRELTTAAELAALAAQVELEPARRDAIVDAAGHWVAREVIAAPEFALRADECLPDSDRTPAPEPHAILLEIAGLEAEILQGIRDLVARLRPAGNE